MRAKDKEGRRKGDAEAAQEETSQERGGQGELASEQPNDRQTEPEMSGEIPSVNTFNKITQLHSVCLCMCVCPCVCVCVHAV